MMILECLLLKCSPSKYFVFILHRIEVEEEIRAQVDELMRQELKNLKIVNILE